MIPVERQAVPAARWTTWVYWSANHFMFYTTKSLLESPGLVQHISSAAKAAIILDRIMRGQCLYFQFEELTWDFFHFWNFKKLPHSMMCYRLVPAMDSWVSVDCACKSLSLIIQLWNPILVFQKNHTHPTSVDQGQAFDSKCLAKIRYSCSHDAVSLA